MSFLSINLQYYSSILVGLTAIVGDLLVNRINLQIFKAIIDNATHALIGGLSWFIVSLKYKNHHPTETLLDIFCCTLLSSFIDLDHFITAKSFYLKDATSLKQRPFLHCTTIPLIITFTLLPVTYVCQWHWLKKFVLILATAFFTHHTRDATRRGYWIYPFGTTPPVPYVIYILLTIIIPFVIIYLRNYMQIHTKLSNTIEV